MRVPSGDQRGFAQFTSDADVHQGAQHAALRVRDHQGVPLAAAAHGHHPPVAAPRPAPSAARARVSRSWSPSRSTRYRSFRMRYGSIASNCEVTSAPPSARQAMGPTLVRLARCWMRPSASISRVDGSSRPVACGERDPSAVRRKARPPRVAPLAREQLRLRQPRRAQRVRLRRVRRRAASRATRSTHGRRRRRTPGAPRRP